MNLMIVTVVVFVAVAGIVGAVAVVIRDFGGNKAEDRLDVFTGKAKARKGQKILREELFTDVLKRAPSIVREIFGRLGNLPKLFDQADTSVKLNQFLLLTGLLAFSGGGACVWFGAPLSLVPVVAGTLGILPLTWLLMRRRRRLRVFGSQLPDALELIGRALRAGHSLAAGMHVVSEEMPNPVALEFGRVYEEQNLGIPLEDAMKNMCERVPNLDLKFFVTAVQLQKQTGGDLAEILDKISYVIRERFKIYGQVQALTAEGRLSGIVLLALPPLLFLAVYYLNPPYIMLLFTEPMGRQMLAGAVVMQILGAVTIKKIVNIKV